APGPERSRSRSTRPRSPPPGTRSRAPWLRRPSRRDSLVHAVEAIEHGLDRPRFAHLRPAGAAERVGHGVIAEQGLEAGGESIQIASRDDETVPTVAHHLSRALDVERTHHTPG